MYIISIVLKEMTGASKGVAAAKERSCKYIRNKGPVILLGSATNPL